MAEQKGNQLINTSCGLIITRIVYCMYVNIGCPAELENALSRCVAYESRQTQQHSANPLE